MYICPTEYESSNTIIITGPTVAIPSKTYHSTGGIVAPCLVRSPRGVWARAKPQTADSLFLSKWRHLAGSLGMTLNSGTQRVEREGINITAACCNLSPLVVEVVTVLFGNYL